MSNPETQFQGAEQEAGAHVMRGRRTLIMLFLAAGLPVLISFGLYFSGVGVPEGRTNRGTLIQPPLALSSQDLIRMKDQQPVVFQPDEKWLVFVVGGADCDEACRTVLHKTRQVTKALGRHALRVKRGYVLPGVEPSEALQGWIKEEHPWLQLLKAPAELSSRLDAAVSGRPLSGNEVFVVDPLGNVMMVYAHDQDGRDLLDDLNRLLKVSKIG